MKVRGGSGLGDSIYLRPIADYLVSRGQLVTVMSNHLDVFNGCAVTIESVNKSKPVDMIAHYTTERFKQDSTQWQDILRTAKLPANLRLQFKWSPRNRPLLEHVRRAADGAPILLVHGGRAPFGRADGYGKGLMPQRKGFMTVLDMFRDCFTVRIGQGEQYPLSASLDLSNRTTVSDIIDLATICTGVITQCGFPVPLAECFDKPVLAVWGAMALRSRDKVIASITPAKIFCKGLEMFVVDEWSADQTECTVQSWRAQARLFQEMRCAAM